MLTLNQITKTFAKGTVNEKTALAGIDLHLDQGDFVTILGSNGAGKSTLFGAIAGTFLPADVHHSTGGGFKILRCLHDSFRFRIGRSHSGLEIQGHAQIRTVVALGLEGNLQHFRLRGLGGGFRGNGVRFFIFLAAGYRQHHG